jgi:hypothetical protein
VGSEQVARAPQVRALRARPKRAEQELGIFKNALASCLLEARARPAAPVSHCQHTAPRAAQLPVRQLCQGLRVAPAAYYAWQRRRQQPAVEPARQVAGREAFVYHSQRYGTRRLRVLGGVLQQPRSESQNERMLESPPL